VSDLLAIPPDLDRALAVFVTTAFREAAPPAAALAGGDSGARVAPAAYERLDAILAGITAALRAHGARPADVTDALDDAFAALAAGHPAPAHRAVLGALTAHARRRVAAPAQRDRPGGPGPAARA
jgi:hypothetical protein